MKTALEVQPGYAQLHVPFLLGTPNARRSGEDGERERERAGGDLSEGTEEWMPRPAEDEAE